MSFCTASSMGVEVVNEVIAVTVMVVGYRVGMKLSRERLLNERSGFLNTTGFLRNT